MSLPGIAWTLLWLTLGSVTYSWSAEKHTITPVVPSQPHVDSTLSPPTLCDTEVPSSPGSFVPLADPDLQLIGTPNGNLNRPAPKNHCHQALIDAIAGAKTSIEMTMFHLTDQTVIGALILAHKNNPNLQVSVILDPSTPSLTQTIQTLQKAGIPTVPSSPCFKMTHEKSLVIDHDSTHPTSIIGAMNMTGEDQTATTLPSNSDVCQTTRDFDVITHDPTIAGDLDTLFQQDRKSAQTSPPISLGGCVNPTLKSPSLVLSPTNSSAKLVKLIQSSYDPKTSGGVKNKTIRCTAENWGDPDIQQALMMAADQGVKIQIIAPGCDQNKDPNYNFDQAKTLPMLVGHPGITVMAMPAPPSHSQPYMHSKMCRINDSVTYVGSVNFSTQSTTENRELGIIFKDTGPQNSRSPGALIDGAFAADSQIAQTVPNPVPSPWPGCGN